MTPVERAIIDGGIEFLRKRRARVDAEFRANNPPEVKVKDGDLAIRNQKRQMLDAGIAELEEMKNDA